MTQNYIGVDLSKDWLDVHDPRSGQARVANTDPAISRFLATLGSEDMIVFEATSLCDGRLLRLASATGQAFHRLNPLHGWHFSRSLNLPKTDRVDARMLARLGAERAVQASPALNTDRAELAELTLRRDQLKRMETQEKNRLGKAFSATVKADMRASLRSLAGRVVRIEAAISAFLATHPALAHQAQLLRSIPGIGAVASITLLGSMPELGHCDRRQIASLGGLAPKARESGKWVGRRSIGDGRRHIRRALYMAALSAMRHGSFCAGFVRELPAKGKPGKVIAVAVARKLLTVANAVLRDQKPFERAD